MEVVVKWIAQDQTTTSFMIRMVNLQAESVKSWPITHGLVKAKAVALSTLH